MPYDVPSNTGVSLTTWFNIIGNSNPNKPSRVSDIKIVGYRSIDSSSTTMYTGFYISEVMNFRVDHCCLENICGIGIRSIGHYCNGVIDHNIFDNTNGIPDPYAERTVGYAIFPSRADPEYDWDENLQNIL
ncbi:unnamed protein product, partial [marine sediment metagenome]